MYQALGRKILDSLAIITKGYNDFHLIIEKKRKNSLDFENAYKIGIDLYKSCDRILPTLKKIVKKSNCSNLKKSELHELLYLFKIYKKNKIGKRKKDNKTFKFKLFDNFYDGWNSKIIMDRNSVFIHAVNYISRNFLNLTLPNEFDVDKFKNDSNRISLLNMLNTTDWSKYIADSSIRKEMISFSRILFSAGWWNHSKYYRNIFVHRISIDTYYSKNYEKMNVRIDAYLPVLLFLMFKYYVYNLLQEFNINSPRKQQGMKFFFNHNNN